MSWYANTFVNTYNNNTWSPLICPWNCQMQMRQPDNPATDIIIKGKEALDVFISDIVIHAFVKNITKWINAFKIDTRVPNVTDVQNKFIQYQDKKSNPQKSNKNNKEIKKDNSKNKTLFI
eukprot:242438_1